MALVHVERLSYCYPGAETPALDNVSLDLDAGEVVVVLGPSGSGKSTLLRAFGGLVPHFHGGSFSGRVVVDGLDTRDHRASGLAGTTAFVFQDPEEQIVLNGVTREVAFGLEHTGVEAAAIESRAHAALAAVGVAHLAQREVHDLSGGELQRVCLASALALNPALLILDEPTSQLDPEAADALLDLAVEKAHEGAATVVLSEQRPQRALARADRILFVEDGVVCEVTHDWLERLHPDYVEPIDVVLDSATRGEPICRLRDVSFSYGEHLVVSDRNLALRRGEIVALLGPNGSGKTTIAKLAAGLLEPDTGTAEHQGRATMLLQDAGRLAVADRADDEVAVAIGGDRHGAREALELVGLADKASRHPRDLSSGERERLALASVIAPDPDLLVLDEPTKGADPTRKRHLAELLREQADRRATLLVTHDIDFASSVADRTIDLGHTREPVLA